MKMVMWSTGPTYQQESKAMTESLKVCLGNKDQKRTADYRSVLVKTTAGYLSQQNALSEKPLAIINTLVEMQRILYAAENLRCPSLILRYYNQSWLHSILLKELIKKPKKLTRQKLFGIYFQNLSAHAGMMLLLISGQAEQQERIFNHIKCITGSTSNYDPEQIIPNVFVCLQAEKEMHLHADDASQQQAEICQLAEVLPPNTTTSLPRDGKLIYSASVISSLKERVFGGEDMKTRLCSMTLRTAQVLITMALNYEKHNLKVPTYEIMKNDEEASVLLKKLKVRRHYSKSGTSTFKYFC